MSLVTSGQTASQALACSASSFGCDIACVYVYQQSQPHDVELVVYRRHRLVLPRPRPPTRTRVRRGTLVYSPTKPLTRAARNTLAHRTSHTHKIKHQLTGSTVRHIITFPRYSCGVTLLELWCGHIGPTFEEYAGLSYNTGAVCGKRVFRKVRQEITAALQRLEKVEPEVASMLRRSVSTNPGRRPAPSALIRMFKRLTRTARPVSVRTRARKRSVQHRSSTVSLK